MPRSVIELETHLSELRAWRVKEISSVRKLAEMKNRSIVESQFFCRAGATLFYAHWEGFVKRSAEAYLKYISYQKIEFSQMSDFVVFNIFYEKIKTGNSLEAAEKISKLVVFNQKSKPYLNFKDVISTESNLSSKVFMRILKTIGISTYSFETKFKAIDAALGSRNPIAHGAIGDVDVARLVEIGDLVIGLTSLLKDEIECAAAERRFIRAPSAEEHANA